MKGVMSMLFKRNKLTVDEIETYVKNHLYLYDQHIKKFEEEGCSDSLLCECLKSQRVTCKEILGFIKARKAQR